MLRENIYYLKTAEELYKRLYSNDIKQIKAAMEDVFNAFPLIQEFSPFYNDYQSMTKIMMMCTNQAIISSISYLTNNNTVSIWKQPKTQMITKLRECITLKDHVLYCYNKSLNKSIVEERKEFKILLNTSLGNILLYVERLNKVINK